jgi:hypothetical protein
VAAIREQKGRFLERDSKKGTWYDIGDKKAIEKTSQALREGQPKLRQKMVELGQIPPDQADQSDEQPPQCQEQQQQQQQQSFNNGIYVPRQAPSINSLNTIGTLGSGSYGSGPYNQFNVNAMGDMPPPPTRSLSNDINMQNEMAMLQRLSLTGNNISSLPSWTPSLASMTSNNPIMDDRQLMSANNRNNFQTMFNSRGGSGFCNDIGMSQQQIKMSFMSDISAFDGGLQERNMPTMIDPTFGPVDNASLVPPQFNNLNNNHNLMNNRQSYRREQNFIQSNGYDDGIAGRSQQQTFENNRRVSSGTRDDSTKNHLPPPPPPPPPPPDSISPLMNASPSIANARFDRRRFFAKMKYGGPPSKRSIVGGDGMPDIHMVDSQFSLLSNLSGHGASRHTTTMDFSSHNDGGGGLSGGSNHKEAMGSEYIGVGSRRSLMSGLSRIGSTHSDVFGDMARKVGTSNRSIAMSEISGIDEGFEGEMDEFSFDLPTPRPTPKTADAKNN